MKKIVIVLMALLLASTVLGEDFSNNVNNGDPYDVQVRAPSFTVVSGYRCQDYPATTINTYNTDGKICMSNNRFWPIDLAVGETNADGTFARFVGEVGIDQGDYGCLDVEPNDYYLVQTYNCDIEQTTCEEVTPYYTAGCDYDICNEGEVLRIRQVKALETNGCVDWDRTACISDDGMGFTCDGANSEAEANAGESGEGSSSNEASSSTLEGQWINPAIPPVGEPGKTVLIKGTFKALQDGRYYLEAGILPKSFSVSKATVSQCDGSENFAGVYVDMKAGDLKDFEGTPIAPDKDGNYDAALGAYTGCKSEGGRDVASLTKIISVKETVDRGGSNDGGFPLVGVGIGAFVIVTIFGGLWWFLK